MNSKWVIASIMVSMMLIPAMCILIESDDTSATITTSGSGTVHNPYTSIQMSANDCATVFPIGVTTYVQIGGHIEIAAYVNMNPDLGNTTKTSVSVTAGHGLSISQGILSGTVTGNNGEQITIGIETQTPDNTTWIDYYQFTIIDPATTYTATWVNYDNTVLEIDSGLIYETTPVYNGQTPTKPASDPYFYVFTGWSPQVGPITADVTYTAQFQTIDTSEIFTITWVNYDNTVLETDSVSYGITPTYDGETPTKPSSGGNDYIFTGWSPQVGPATSNVTYTAQFQVNSAMAFWTNGNPNGSVSVLYHIDKPNETNRMLVTYPLYKYNENIRDNYDTEINESFEYTGYSVKVFIQSIKVGSSNKVTLTASLHNSNDSVIAINSVDLGSWNAFIINVDTINATVSYTKVMQFRTFTDYKESVTETILSYGSMGDYQEQVTQSIRFSPSGTAPKQSVVKTSVFLNTYGVVLKDPSIDIGTFFPELTKIRLNFYSFALYGNSMTVNGHTMQISSPNITFYYTQSGNDYYIADGPGDNISQKTLELTNIYITWDGTNCYLTFVNDNFTINMGSYSDKAISFTGLWYYATALYEPYTAQETSYDVDWWDIGNFDYSAFGIVLAVLLILGGLIAKVTIGGRTLDYVIIVLGVIIALIIAGGLINA